MYKQLTALFARYVAAHLKAQGKPRRVTDRDDKLLGTIDVIALSDGQIRVAGWAQADDIVLHMNGVKASTKPTLLRDDVAAAHGINPHLGFDLVLPLGPVTLREINRFGLEFHLGDPFELAIALPLSLDRLRLVQASLIVNFIWSIMLQIPSCIGWSVTRNPRYRARIKQGLRLTALPVTRELDPDLFRVRVPHPKPTSGITIVMPVFNAFDLLRQALAQVVDHTDVPWRLILIEDASTDCRVKPFLEALRSQYPDQVILLENKSNTGFIHSVNRGLAQALLWNDPVVLLNSDALVPADWASRLIAPMLDRSDVASVTPMSNDAEIFTMPLICKPTPLAAGQGRAIDAVAARLNPDAERVCAPTGVGFCMAINPKYLHRIPQLDVEFGRGYGEEVDWCQRVRALGGTHLCAPNLFVEHCGGQSFGHSEKRLLIAANNQKISRRYPGYDTEVQRFVQSDPLRSTRLALALAWAGAQDTYPVSIYLAHSMGGGAEAYLQDRIAKKHNALGRTAIILRVGGRKRWQIEVLTPDGIISGQTDGLDYVRHMLAPITRRRIVYSCGVGDHDPAALPDDLLKLSDGGRHTIEMLFHDYFAMSPSYTLLDDHGVYGGVPSPSGPDNPAHTFRYSGGNMVALQTWQASWAKLVDAAKDLVVFSENSAQIVASAFPDASQKIVLRPHQILQKVPRVKVPDINARRVIGVLGDIGLQKGAGLLNGLAQHLERDDIGLAIIGNFDPGFPIPPSVPVHGTYRIADIAQIAARYGVTDWLVPSIWPETFSFTTHEALATGLPVHAFGMGAQGDAVARAENGILIVCAEGVNLEALLRQHFTRYLNQLKRAA